MSDVFRQDCRQALTGLVRSSGFTATAVVTLALSLGATVTLFSLLNALTLRTLPVPHPEQLVHVATGLRSGAEAPLSFPMFRELSSRQTLLASTFGWFGDPVLSIETDGGLTQGTVIGVSGNFHSELGATATAGRLLLPSDVDLTTFTGAQLAVVGHGFWMRRLGADRNAIGRIVRVEGVPFVVVGIAPRDFKGLGLLAEPDVTVPLTAYPALFRSEELRYAAAGNVLWMRMAARMRPGTTFEQARAELEALWPRIKSDIVPASHAGDRREAFLGLRLLVRPLSTGVEIFLRPRYTRPLQFLLGVALVMLLIACANLAQLVLVRVAGRSHELAVLMALGASRWQVGRRVFLEVLAVTWAGATAGIGICYWGGPALTAAILPGGPVTLRLDVSPDWRVVVFATLIALVAALAIAAIPCERATRRDVHNTLVQNRHRPRAGSQLTTVLLGAQVALSVLLLTHAGLLARSLQHLMRVDPGYSTDDLTQVTVRPRPETVTRPDPHAYYPALTEHVVGMPGVRQASVALFALAAGPFLQPVSLPSTPSSDGMPAAFNAVSPAFFATVGVPILQGRDFTWADREQSPRVAMISRSLADHLFPDEQAVGQIIRIGTQPNRQNLEVVGIVGDAKLYDFKASSAHAAYIPALQFGELSAGVVMLVRGGSVLEQELQRVVQSAGPGYVVYVASLSESFATATSQERVTASVAAFFGVLALALAGLGMGTLAAYAVTQRTKEIGVRVALGASRGAIVKGVLGRAMAAGGAGIVVGAPIALASVGVVESLLFGVSPRDPVVLVVVPAVLLLVIAVACLVPARRAASIDPAVSLRAE